MRFEPDAVVIHNADDRDRHLEDLRRQGGDSIECSIRRRVEYVVAANRREATRLIQAI